MPTEYQKAYYQKHKATMNQLAKEKQKEAYADETKRELIKARNRERYRLQREAFLKLKEMESTQAPQATLSLACNSLNCDLALEKDVCLE